jgi:hypothetical protein
MELINSTRMPAACTMAMDASGREFLVVVVKGTFMIPRVGEQVRLSQEQASPVLADTFTGEPGVSAPVHESDFALRKPSCDVLLVGSAQAPDGRPVARMQVGLKVGTMSKVFEVVGDRTWDVGLTGIQASPPLPFVMQRVTYDFAFGGIDTEAEDPVDHGACRANPVGRGYRRHVRRSSVAGRPLPNTEAIGHPVTSPTGNYVPMALGPVGRGWVPRSELAGTYDQRWLDETFPFLPADFDERYFQAAPVDQQLAHSSARGEVALQGFTSDGVRRFMLPSFEAPIHVFPRKGSREDHVGVLDTIAFEPDHGRFTMTWRLTRPLRRDLFEIAQVLVGRKGPAWWQLQEEVAAVPMVIIPSRRAPLSTKA